MIYEGFKIGSIEHIHDAYCTSYKCRKKVTELIEVSNGLLSRALFCPECHAIYILKLERVRKVNKEFLEQCLEEVDFQNRKKNLIDEMALEKEKKREQQREARMKKEDERLARLEAKRKRNDTQRTI